VCRILDLTDSKGFHCMNLFADLGADVTRVEKPGDPARNVPPLADDMPHPEKGPSFLHCNGTHEVLHST
jgi:crotonobetainyl-CoA:carnitine CoA-transferase CaiB-like acyl-CoA transferase